MSEELTHAMLAQASTEPSSDGSALILAPKENRVYRVKSSEVPAYEKRGFQRYSGATVDDNELNRTLQDWGRSLRAGAYGAVNNLPFASYGIEKLADPQTAQDYATNVAKARIDHPTAYNVGAVAGFAGSAAALSPLARAFSGVLGAGAEAASAATTGSEALNAATPTLEKLLSSPLAGQLGTAASEGALFSGAQSASDQLGDAAMAERLTPEDKEKLAFSFNRLAMDSAIGAGFGGALKAAGLGIKAAGRAMATQGKTILRRSVISEEAEKLLQKQAEQAGHNPDFDPAFKAAAVDLADDMAMARQQGKSPERLVADNVHSAATTLADKRARIENTRVDPRKLADILDGLSSEQVNSAVLAKHLTPLRQYVDNALSDNAKASLDATLKPSVLQSVVEDIRKDVNFYAQEKNPIYKSMETAAARLSELENQTVTRHLGPKVGEEFKGAKRAFHVNSSLASLMNPKEAATIQDLLKATASAGVANAFAAAVGAKSMGIGRALGQGAAFNFVGMAPNAAGFTGKYMTSVGEHFAKSDHIVWQTLAAGLKGAAPGVNDMRHAGDYQQWAARVLAAKAAPLENHANIVQGLTAAGLTDAQARPVALQLHGAMIDAANKLPPRQGPTDMATLAQPDPMVQRKWMAQVRSSMDPAYALKFPTAQNMQAAKQYFPQTIQKAQAALMEQAAKNPSMPASRRYYISRVLGRPVSSASDPKFYQMIMQLRQQGEAQQAQGMQGPGPQSGSNKPAGVTSEQTQLEEISQ